MPWSPKRPLWPAALISLALCLLLGGCARCEGPENPPARTAGGRADGPPAAPAVDMPSFAAMRVVLLGTGTPTPDPERSKPAVAIIADGRPYVVDFGAGVVQRAVQAHDMGVAALDIRRLSRAFATHLHSDHTSGLSDLWLTPAAVGRLDSLVVHGPEGIEEMVSNIFDAYAADLQVRTQGRSLDRLPAGYRLEAKKITAGTVYEDSRITVTAFPVSHGEWAHAFGYRFESRGRVVVISGDTAPTDTVVAACDGCDVLVHEVYCKAGFDQGPPGFKQYHGAYHTSTAQLAEIAARARPKLLVLYHLLFFGCTEADLLGELTSRYDGEVALGRDLAVY